METNKLPRCIHRHTPLTHPACFKPKLETKPPWWQDLRIGYLDIEATDLKADFGFMLSWAIKDKNGAVYSDVITKQEIFDEQFDRRINRTLLRTMRKFGILVTYYGTGFDLPYIRARSLKNNLAFPVYGEIYHWDLYYKVRSQLAISRKSLGVSTAFLGIDGKTPVTGNHWAKAKFGNPQALSYVLQHNIADVEILEDLHKRLENFSKWTKKSI